jgi:hypothetical protein
MIGRIVGGVLLGTFVAAIVYEILDREKPELFEKIRDWIEKEDDFLELQEEPVE